VNRWYYNACWGHIRQRIDSGEVEFWFRDGDTDTCLCTLQRKTSDDGYVFKWANRNMNGVPLEILNITSVTAILRILGNRQYELGRANYSSIVNGNVVGLEVAKSGMAMIFKELAVWLKEGKELFSTDNPFTLRSTGKVSLGQGIKIAEVEIMLSRLVWEAIEYLYSAVPWSCNIGLP
jgi:hypothetical protein